MSLCPYCKSCLDKVIWDGDIGYDSYLCGTRVTRFDPVRSEACKAAELDHLRAVNAELLNDIENIKQILESLSLSGMDDYDIMGVGRAIRIAAESIAKAEGKTE